MVGSFLIFACHLSCELEPHSLFSIHWETSHFLSKTERLILIIRILIISFPWALFGSRFLIIFRISSVEKSIVDRDSCLFLVRVTGNSLFLLTIEHWLAKKLLKILAFSLKSATNLSWCSSGGMQGIFIIQKGFQY